MQLTILQNQKLLLYAMLRNLVLLKKPNQVYYLQVKKKKGIPVFMVIVQLRVEMIILYDLKMVLFGVV